MSAERPVQRRGPVVDSTSIAEMLGGPRGVVESTVPGVVFAVAYSVNGQELGAALVAAVASGALVMLAALVQRRPVRQALGGFVGVAAMALFARFTGRAEDFFLWSVLKNPIQGLAYLVSIMVRWPLLGVILGPVFGEGFTWRKDPARLRAYSVASWFWVAMFGIRAAVQVPLYFAGAVAALGFMSVPLGLPLFALTCWLSYVVLRRVPVTRLDPATDDTGATEATETTDDAASEDPAAEVTES